MPLPLLLTIVGTAAALAYSIGFATGTWHATRATARMRELYKATLEVAGQTSRTPPAVSYHNGRVDGWNQAVDAIDTQLDVLRDGTP